MFALLSGAVSLLIGILLIGVMLPQAVAEEADFRAAAPCPPATTTQWTDCVQAAWFTVEDVELRKGRGATSSVMLAGPPAWSGRADFESENPLLRRLLPGEQVAGTVWRGEIVAVSAQRRSQRTSAHPVGDSLLVAGLGVALALAGGLGLYAARWWIRRPHDCVHRTPSPLAVAGWTAGGLGSYSIVLMLVLRAHDAPLWLLAGLWAAAGLPACGTAAFLMRPAVGRAGGLPAGRSGRTP